MLTPAEITKLRAEISMAAWDIVPPDLRTACASAEADRRTARKRFAGEPGVISDFLFALDVADEFERMAGYGYSARNALTLATMNTRVRWAAIRKQTAKAA